jgi:hypothetical protein
MALSLRALGMIISLSVGTIVAAAAPAAAQLKDGPCSVQVPNNWTVSGRSATAPGAAGTLSIDKAPLDPASYVSALIAISLYQTKSVPRDGMTVVTESESGAPMRIHSVRAIPGEPNYACHAMVSLANPSIKNVAKSAIDSLSAN